MLKKISSVFLCLFLSLLFLITASAHSGGTDSNGGHYNRSTGEYHFHHGRPAHSHDNGCPYDTGKYSTGNWFTEDNGTIYYVGNKGLTLGEMRRFVVLIVLVCIVFLVLVAAIVKWICKIRRNKAINEQRLVLKFILEEYEKTGYSVSISHIANHFDITNYSAQEICRELIKNGNIDYHYSIFGDQPSAVIPLKK